MLILSEQGQDAGRTVNPLTAGDAYPLSAIQLPG